MWVWGSWVASRDRWLHEVNFQGGREEGMRVKTPVLSEGHRWTARSLSSQSGEETDVITVPLAPGVVAVLGCPQAVTEHRGEVPNMVREAQLGKGQ